MDITDFIAFRKELHRHPEVSGQERQTKQRVLDFIRPFRPDDMIEVGKYGLVFVFKGGAPGKSMMIRAELDALPIQEVNDFEHRSAVANVSHKCGHDGHMAILSRLAYLLSERRPERGTCYLLFQPAEETGAGAREVYRSEAFQSLNVDRIFALHNIPGYPLSSIIVKENTFTPAVSSIIVKLKGKTSHAAEPEKGINPAAAIAAYIQQATGLTQAEEHREDFFLVTPVYLTMGERSYGVSAGYGEVHLTIRSWDNTLLRERAGQLERMAADLARQFHLQHEIEWTQDFKANENDPSCVRAIREAAQSLNLDIIERDSPMKWGEDFGLLTTHYRGAMFGLGSGEHQPALHNPDYDFPDSLIETGSNMFEQIVRDFLKE